MQCRPSRNLKSKGFFGVRQELSCGIVGWSIGIGLFWSAILVADDDLEKLVRRLELTNLEATLVENRLARTIDADLKSQLSERLAGLYIEQLEKVVEQPILFARISERLKELEPVVADLREPKIVFSRLEAEFRHGEYLLSLYREDRRERRFLVDIYRIFSRLLDEFRALELACDKKIETLDLLDPASNTADNRLADEKIDQLSEIGFRCSFYQGWSAFHAGLSKQNRKLGQPFFEQSIKAFCRFLELDLAGGVESWDEEFLELTSLRNSQAFFGVAISFLAIGNLSDADHCFDLLRAGQTADTVVNQLAFWQVQTLLELGQTKDGREMANLYLDHSDELNDIQRGRMALMLIRIAYQDPEKQETELGFLGIRVLTQLRQIGLVQKMIEQFSIPLTGSSFYALWVKGQLMYQKAEKIGEKSQFLAAADVLKSATKMDKDIPLADLERCRYQLGWAYYRGERFSDAAESLDSVIAHFGPRDPDIAATASWLQHDCYLKLDESNPENVNRAISILENLVNRFPDAELARRARLQIVKLQRTKMGSEESLKRLRETVESTPDDLNSQYELVLALYRTYLERLGKKKSDDSSDLAEEIKQLIASIDRLPVKASPTQQLKLILIGLDLQVRSDLADRVALDGLVSRAVPLAAEVGSSVLTAELRYRQYQIARKRGNREDEKRHVTWLVENADGTVFQKSVLVRRVQQLEEELAKESVVETRRQLMGQAIGVYQQLARTSGYNVQGVSSNQNARVAVSRLSELMEETGDWKGAERNLELLTRAFPAKVIYLQRYARILMRGKQYERSLAVWRKLVTGLQKETDDWYEAKYSVILCLAETDLEKARPPLVQFLMLYEPPGKWKAEFSDLAVKLGIR